SFHASYRPLSEKLNDEKLVQAFSRLLNYIQYTQKRSLDHLKQAEVIELKDYLSLDMYSKRNLELTETILRKGKHGSLLRSEEHTSELQSRFDLVCRLLLEKK